MRYIEGDGCTSNNAPLMEKFMIFRFNGTLTQIDHGGGERPHLAVS